MKPAWIISTNNVVVPDSRIGTVDLRIHFLSSPYPAHIRVVEPDLGLVEPKAVEEAMLLMVDPLIAIVIDAAEPRYVLPSCLIRLISSPEVRPVADGKNAAGVLEGVLIVVAAFYVNGIGAFRGLGASFGKGERALIEDILNWEKIVPLRRDSRM